MAEIRESLKARPGHSELGEKLASVMDIGGK
jgi:hypothetical protein